MYQEMTEPIRSTKPDGFLGERMTVFPSDTIAKYAKNIFVKRLFLTDVGYFPDAKGHFVNRPAGAEEYIYFYCIDGTGTIVVAEKEFVLHKNMAICIPRHTPHSYFSSEEDPWSILWVHFNGEDTCYYPIDHVKPIFFRSSYSSNRMLFLFNSLFDTAETLHGLEDFIYMSHTLQMILSETYFKDENSDRPIGNNHLNAVLKYMYANISRNIALRELCEEFNFSKSYLNSLFHDKLQTTPIKHFITIKMKEACKMLKATKDTVKMISAKLGYHDCYYFSFLFKKIVGVSPSDYRNSDMIFF